MHWFIEKFQKLQETQPRICLVSSQSENSEYTNYAFQNKNCYLVFGGHYNEDTLYSQYTWKDVSCCDVDKIIKSELCYECVYCSNLYNCNYLFNCFSCSDSEFGYDLSNCRDCFLSAGLRNAQYYIRNKKFTREDYEREVARLKKEMSVDELNRELEEIRATIPQMNMLQKNCENSLGAYMENCKNCYRCFYMEESEDCMYFGMNGSAVKNSVDCDNIGYDPSDFLYESIGINGGHNVNFSNASWHNGNIWYCDLVFNSQDCLGCVSRSHAKYEILNEQYSVEEYEKKFGEIRAELLRENLWGRNWLPSTYPYEDTLAPLWY